MPDDVSERLTGLFLTVLPAVNAEELETLSVTNHPSWDSLVTVTLMAAIEQEFSIAVTPEDLEQFSSYALIRSVVEDRMS